MYGSGGGKVAELLLLLEWQGQELQAGFQNGYEAWRCAEGLDDTSSCTQMQAYSTERARGGVEADTTNLILREAIQTRAIGHRHRRPRRLRVHGAVETRCRARRPVLTCGTLLAGGHDSLSQLRGVCACRAHEAASSGSAPYLPRGHSVHADVPLTSLYVPPLHYLTAFVPMYKCMSLSTPHPQSRTWPWWLKFCQRLYYDGPTTTMDAKGLPTNY